MSISEITSTIQTSTVESSSSSTSEAEASYEVFIQLLAAQLEYQDPTDPTDANEFTNQLVQYSQLEQQMLSNETLTALLETQESGGASSGLDYLGRYVSVDTATATAGDEGVTWTVEVPTGAGELLIEVTDADGNVVSSETVKLDSGSQDYSLSSDLATAGEDYTLSVMAESGDEVGISVEGLVEAADWAGDETVLTLANGTKVGSSDVTSAATTA